MEDCDSKMVAMDFVREVWDSPELIFLLKQNVNKRGWFERDVEVLCYQTFGLMLVDANQII